MPIRTVNLPSETANLLIDFHDFSLYNYTKIIAMRYYTTKYKICQERITTMDDPDIEAMRKMVAKALKKCSDIDLLNLIYLLVIRSSKQS